MGIFPRRNPIQTNQMFGPLADYLRSKLGRRVILSIPNSFQAFWESVQKREYDIVHYNQYHYVKSHMENAYDVIVMNVEFGEPTIAGAIIVRKDSGINNVTDLKGKKIIFGGGPDAMQSYIVASYLLQQNGLNKNDYEKAFAKNPPNAIMSTYFNQSAAAGSGDKVLQLDVVKKQIDTNEMRYLLVGEQLPHLPWAVKRELPAGVKEKIQKTLLGLQHNGSGKTVLKSMHLDRLASAKDSDYDQSRKIIKETLGENY
jgi:phosphonate transport system substrate-binding protein